MIHDFQPGDFLIFQLESGYGLLRVLGVENADTDPIWHIAAYSDLFLDVDMADAALADHSSLTVEKSHIALTNRAFESTQVAKMGNAPLTPEEIGRANAGNTEVSDRSVRLLLGLR